MTEQTRNFAPNPVDLTILANEMPNRIFNTTKSDYKKPDLFLGEPGGILDTINNPYPKLMELHDELKTMDWKRNEFKYERCQVEFKTCSRSHYLMMIRSLAWQWEGDSIAARSISDIILPLCTSAASRTGYTRIADSENLHALTYSEIARGSFEDPNTILNEVLAIRESHGRLASVGKLFEQARKASLEWQTTGVRTPEIEQAVMLFVVAVYALERIQFMASFAITFAFGEMKMFEPITSAVQLIARDEYSNHVPYGEEIFKELIATEWGMNAWLAVRQQIIGVIVEILYSELAWIDYLHIECDELPGTPPAKLKQWSLFNGRAVCVALGILTEVEAVLGYELPAKLPLSYMKDWIAIEDTQISPQEQDSNLYSTNMVSTNNVPTEIVALGSDFDFDD